MLVTQKSQYALRAIFELAKHKGKGPKKIAEIAKAQAIPLRFLEVILSQLKRNGFVESKRGYHGGYFLLRSPDEITVGDIIRYIGGPLSPVHCLDSTFKIDCPLGSNCAFLPLWSKVQKAIFKIYDDTTMQSLLDYEKQNR